HWPEIRRWSVAEVALPEVDRKRQPAETIDRHRVTRTAEVDRGFAVPALVRRVSRHPGREYARKRRPQDGVAERLGRCSCSERECRDESGSEQQNPSHETPLR